jgi:hypothetical protein
VNTRSTRLVLAVGDALAIVLFAGIGLMSHDEGVTAGGLARNALPILVIWFAAAPVLGTCRRPGLRTLLLAWAVSVVAGVFLRKFVFGRPADIGDLPVFLAVTLAVTLAFLLAWRGIAALVLKPRIPAPSS